MLCALFNHGSFWPIINEKTFNHYFYINIFNYRLCKEKEYFMNLDWDLIWKIFQVVSLLIIAREIDKRIRKRKKSYL